MTTTERGPSRSERLNPRNWSLSIKLLIVGLVPTLLALGLGALRISDQADVAANLGRSNELLAVRDQVESAATALRAERDAAVRFVAANRTGDRAPLDAAAQTTDAQLDKAVQALASTESTDDPGVGAQPLRDVKLSMQDLRRDTTSSPLPADGILNRYGDVVSQTDVVVRTLLRQVANPDVAGLTDALAATDSASEQLAVQHTVVAAAVAAGRVTDTDLTLVGATENAYNAAFNSYRLSLTPEQQQRFGLFGTDPANGPRVQLGATILQTTPGRALTIDPAAWDAAYTSSNDAVQKSADAAASQLKQDTTAAQEAASNQAGVNSVILMLGLLLGIAIIVLLARSLLKSLRLLRSSALDVAERQLPEAVESLRTGESPNAHVEPVPIDTRDEVGQVARAFDAVHGQAVRLAADQAALQANVNSMFVNLSRRSQALVERQLQLIEQLESNEQDPDQLSNLFQLDHLATRMRRNSENLLVLAGTELSKRNIAPIPVVDVLRAAVSEVEQYQRIVVQSPPAATVVGRAANDLVHLLAELLDNATNFSPPDSQVVLSSTRTPDGSILVEIADRGVGMAEHELTDANERLGGPAQVDVSASRRMGLFVVGRLAARHGIGVRLGSTGSGGLTASVTVPGYLIPGTPGDAAGPAGAPRMPSVQDGTAGPALPALPQQVTPNGHVVPTGSLADLVVGDDGTTFPPLQTVDGSANGSGPGHHTNGSSPLLPTRRPGANLLSGTSGNGRTPGEMFTPTEADDPASDEAGWALSGPAPGAPAVPESPVPAGSADPATGWALSGPVVPEEELRAAHGLAAQPAAPETGRATSETPPSRTPGAAAAALGGAAAAAALAAARRRARRQPPEGTPGEPDENFSGVNGFADPDDARATGSRPAGASALLGRPKEPTPSPRHDDTGTGEIRIATSPDAAPLPRRTPRPIGPVATDGAVPDLPVDDERPETASTGPDEATDSGAEETAAVADEKAPETGSSPEAAADEESNVDADSTAPEAESEVAELEAAEPEAAEPETADSDATGSDTAESVDSEVTGSTAASADDSADSADTPDEAVSPAAEDRPAPALPSRPRDIGAALAAGLAGTVRGSDDATTQPAGDRSAERTDDTTSTARPLFSGPQAATEKPAAEGADAPADAGDAPATPPPPTSRPGMMRPVPRPGTTPSPSGPADRQPPSALPPPSRPAADGPGRSGLLPRRIPGAGINRAPGGPTPVPPPAPSTPAPEARPAVPTASTGPADLTKAAPDTTPVQPPAPQSPAAQSPAPQSPAAQGPGVQGPAPQSPAAQAPGSLPVRGAGVPVPPQGGDTAGRVPTGEQPAVRPVGEQPAAVAPGEQHRTPPPLPQRVGTPLQPAVQPPAAQAPSAQAPVAPVTPVAPLGRRPAAQAPEAPQPAAQPQAPQAPVAQAPQAQAPHAPVAQAPQAQAPQAQPQSPPQTGGPQTGGLPVRTPGAQSYGRPPAPARPPAAQPPAAQQGYPQQGPPAEEAPSDDDGFSTPIFAEIASAWFRSNRPIPITWADEVPQNGAADSVVPPGSDPLQVRPSPVARPPAPAPVQPVEAAPQRAAADPSAPGEQASGNDDFSSTADVGWEAAERNAETSAGEYTSAGLPKRRPRARLVPGSAGGSAVLASSTSATASATATDAGGRTAEAVRGRLASYQRGIRQGRENRLRRERELAEGRMANSTDAQPAGAGAQDEETTR
ncbi:MAG: HAMP domain-containing protein [Pseudonocardiaceae bacterium]|nr:MAG: HAMP domain-containing protein [Pseudonocardiaceae bacterium]